MDDSDSPPTLITEQGAALVDLVIERARQDPTSMSVLRQYPLYSPAPLSPLELATLALPSGKSLPPSWYRWLAFDASWLAQFDWLSSGDQSQLTPRRLDEVVVDGLEFAGWAKHYARLGDRFDECFLLPPFGDETCRILVVSEPDSCGEYPILVADVDDVPSLDLVYPGLDVYLAAIVGLPVHRRWDANVTWTTAFEEPHYSQRLNQHARQLFAGHREVLVTRYREGGYEVIPGSDDGSEEKGDGGHSITNAFTRDADDFPF